VREQQLAAVFVELADTLVDNFDVIDFLHVLTDRCVTVLSVSAAGLVLVDQRGVLQVAAASSEDTRLLELFQVQFDQGPCLECFHHRRQVVAGDLSGQDADRWPDFTEAARSAGFAAVHAFPMRLRDQALGALNHFSEQTHALSQDAVGLAQAFADVATIGLLQERAIRRQEGLADQLQKALQSRVVIEQAKGVIAERNNVDIGEAFALLRGAARSGNHRLSEFAAEIVKGRAHL